MRDKVSLKDVNPDHVFHLNSGAKIRNLYEFATELTTMPEQTFKHHVSNTKNDFATWIRHSVKDDDLALTLSQITDRRMMLSAVEKRIQELEDINTVHAKGMPVNTIKNLVIGIILGAVLMLMTVKLIA